MFELDAQKIDGLMENEQNDFYFGNCNVENFLFKETKNSSDGLDIERKKYIDYLVHNYSNVIPI